MKVFFLGLLFCLGIVSTYASSHGEAPLDAAFPQTDGTDFYMFRSYETGRDQYVTFLSNWNPRQLPYGGPNFYSWDPKFAYDIIIDNVGDGVDHIKFSFIFSNEYANDGKGLALNISGFNLPIALKVLSPLQIDQLESSGLNYLAYYRINYVTPTGSSPVTEVGNGRDFWEIPFDYAGTKTFNGSYADYAQQFIFPINIPSCATPGKVFVGQRQESFSINLGKVFDLVNFAPVELGSSPFPTTFGIAQDTKNNVLRGTNIGTIALEVPIACLTGAGNGVIGAWTRTIALDTTGNGEERQKSRLGNPLVNELFTGLVSKDRWNSLDPYQQPRINYYILYPTFATILNALFLTPVNSVLPATSQLSRLEPSKFPRNDLKAVFLKGIRGLNKLANADTGPLQDLLRLNTAINVTAYGSQSTFGVFGGDNAGFPNGRRPGDDIVDIALRGVMGAVCHLGIGYCLPSDAPTGTVQYTDGAPIKDTDFLNVFPYLNTPVPGSVDVPCSSINYYC